MPRNSWAAIRRWISGSVIASALNFVEPGADCGAIAQDVRNCADERDEKADPDHPKRDQGGQIGEIFDGLSKLHLWNLRFLCLHESMRVIRDYYLHSVMQV